MAGHSDERFSRPGRGGQDDVIAGEEFEDGLFLGRIQLEADFARIVEERVDDRVWVRAVARKMVEKTQDLGALSLDAEALEGGLRTVEEVLGNAKRVLAATAGSAAVVA